MGSAKNAACDYDVIVIGAGFSGRYVLHKLRELDFRHGLSISQLRVSK